MHRLGAGCPRVQHKPSRLSLLIVATNKHFTSSPSSNSRPTPSRSADVPVSRHSVAAPAAAPTTTERLSETSTSYDSGGNGSIPPLKWTGDDGYGDRSDPEVEDALAKAGIKASDLPQDMQDARLRGKVTAKHIEAWAKFSSLPLLGFLCRVVPSFRDRLLGNPRFLTVLGIELAVGIGAKLSAEREYRGERFMEEINMVASDMALEVIADVTTVWLLSTRANYKAPSNSALSQWSRQLPAHAFQIGDFTLRQRASNLLLRGAQFLGAGFGSSLLGHTLTTHMVHQQHKKAPEGTKPRKLAPVLPNSIGWGSFMATAANTRYQLVNCIEERFLDKAVGSPAAKALLSLLLRFSNTYCGGMQWMWFASKAGLQ